MRTGQGPARTVSFVNKPSLGVLSMSRMPTELLAAFSGSVRFGLQHSSMRIHRTLDNAEETRELTGRSSRIYPAMVAFNLGALLEVSFGRPHRAAALCEAAIQWLALRARDSSTPGIMSYSFQPWINLTRLSRYRRDWTDTDRRLRLLRDAYKNKDVKMGGLHIKENDWPSMSEYVPNFEQYLFYNWVQQELLCAIQRGEVEQVDHLAMLCEDNSMLHGMATEAQVILKKQIEIPKSTDHDQRLRDVLAIRLAENLTQQELQLTDMIAIEELDIMAARLLEHSSAGIWELAAVQAAVKLLEPVASQSAAKHSATAFHLAQQLGDEVFGAWFAGACIRCNHSDPSFLARAQDFEERSWHVRVRRRDHPDHDVRCSAIDRVSERLFEIAADSKSFPTAAFQQSSAAATSSTVWPTLLGELVLKPKDDHRATVNFRFAPQRIKSLGPALGNDVSAQVRAQADAHDFTGQRNIAAQSVAVAMLHAEPITGYLLNRIVSKFREHLGSLFEEDRLAVTIRVDQHGSYVQLQQAHIDWARTVEFHEPNWRGTCRPAPTTSKTFRNLGGCSSIDCVLGGPATDFFLGEHHGKLHLVKQKTPYWTVDGITFSDLVEPTPGPIGELLFRPPYTIHQFPAPERWVGGNTQRLFVSCDYQAT